MKYLKNPVIAVLLSAIIVLSSTFISAGAKLSKASDKVTEGFYQGVSYEGYKHKSISGQLENICGAVSGLMTIARNQGIDTAELSGLNSALSDSVSGKKDGVSAIHERYASLMDALYPMLNELSASPLTERDENGSKEYMVTIMGAEKVIDESGYNETVQEFLKDMSGFPMNFFISVTGTRLPETFE